MVKLSLLCAIIGKAGSVFGVDIDDGEQVWKLKEAIKMKKPLSITCEADQLQLFLAKKDNGAWLTEVEAGDSVPKGFKMMKATLFLKNSENFGEDFKPGEGQVHVLVVVPSPDVGSKRPADDEVSKVLKRLKLIEPKTLTEFTPLSVHEDEFLLDELLSLTRQSDNPIVMTPTLHEFWKEFGEFPPHYFVRMEEVVFWRVIKKLLFDKERVVIIGSPGVGKSCFLMLIAFYLACFKNEKVLVIRRLNERKHMNAVVFFDGQGSYARLSDLSSQDIKAIRGQFHGALVLVDGFNQAEVEDPDNSYLPFDFLATSCQFDAKHDDSSCVVVLPAWREADLLQYAKSTKWVVETGLRKVTRQNTPFAKLVKEQHFYSGGSLREFCKERHVLEQRVANNCRTVNNGQAFELVYNYGGGQSKTQVDRLRRHFVTDCNQEVGYRDSRCWFLSVDSGYVLSRLGKNIDTGKQLNVYTYAKSIGAGFHDVVYKLLLHNVVREAFVSQKPVVLTMREGSKYEKIEIQAEVDCRGEDEASCYSCLSKLRDSTYWHPDYPFFPFIDAVATCKAFPSKSEAGGKGQDLSNKPKTIVAYIQVTIRSEKKFKEEKLRRLNEEMDKNSSLKDMERAFVVVGPDFGVCETFDLKGAPDPNTFLTMVSCFSLEQLKPQVKTRKT